MEQYVYMREKFPPIYINDELFCNLTHIKKSESQVVI